MRLGVFTKLLAGTALAWIAGLSPAIAQRTNSTIDARPSPPPSFRPTSPPMLRLITPAQAPIFTMSIPPNMTGWTKITNGPINGSPALIQFPDNGPLALVGVGGDGVLMVTSINRQTGSIDATQWAVLANEWQATGVACSQGSVMDSGSYGVFCHGRTSSGAAQAIGVTHVSSPSRFHPYPYAAVTAGSNGIGLPSGIMYNNGTGASWASVRFMKAGNGLWVNSRTYSAGLVPVSGEASAWRLLPYTSTLGSNLVCGVQSNFNNAPVCAARSASNFLRVASGSIMMRTLAYPEDGAFDATTMFMSSPAATASPNEPLTSTPAVVVHTDRTSIMIRDFDGSLKRINFDPQVKGSAAFSAWTDEGGFLAPGSQPSCVADGAVPVCVIQGPDGAAYFKRLSPVVGL